MKYYIYHIEGVKIGVSTEPETRIRKQGFETFELLEEHTDIYIASDREQELQKQYGYRVDKAPYYMSYNSRSNAGKSGGRNSHKNGSSQKQLNQLAKARDPQKAANARKTITCKHCDVTGLTGNINRWHNDNCKLRKFN